MITITGGQVAAGQISSAGVANGQVLTADGAGGVVWEAAGGLYSSYVAFAKLAGTGITNIVVLQNDTGLTWTWGHLSTGIYKVTASSVIPINKIYGVAGKIAFAGPFQIAFVDINVFESELRVNTRDISYNNVNVTYEITVQVEIRVYP